MRDVFIPVMGALEEKKILSCSEVDPHAEDSGFLSMGEVRRLPSYTDARPFKSPPYLFPIHTPAFSYIRVNAKPRKTLNILKCRAADSVQLQLQADHSVITLNYS